MKGNRGSVGSIESTVLKLKNKADKRALNFAKSSDALLSSLHLNLSKEGRKEGGRESFCLVCQFGLSVRKRGLSCCLKLIILGVL